MPRFFNPKEMCPPFNPYSQGAEVKAGSRMVYFAGQVGADIDGKVSDNFEEQITQTYRNIEIILKEAGMGFENLVKVNTYLSRREDAPKMRDIRKAFLGDHKPAHTLLFVSGFAYEEFLIEVEGVAAEDPA
ncbi:MAG: RidA family protein [Rhodospirillales bacterium]|nr:RidA family protein [Rhodospirillales bacterium]